MKILTHFFNEIWLYNTQNTFYLIVGGLKNAFLMPLTPLLYHYLTVLWQSSSSSKEELGILVVGWKWLFWCKIHFRLHKFIIQDKKHNNKNSQKTIIGICSDKKINNYNYNWCGLHFYRTRVRSLVILVSHWLTDSLPFSKLHWCDPGMWRCLLKTCWGCYCCWWWW